MSDGTLIPLDAFMADANARYYARGDVFGVHGDFITAPEISQMFGEMVGICLADWRARAGLTEATYVELGPGRGTLACDALRTMAAFGPTPPVAFVETSEALRAQQAAAVPDAVWFDRVDTVPDTGPLLIVANEFFDALPIVQWQQVEGSWHRVMASFDGARWNRVVASASTITPESESHHPPAPGSWADDAKDGAIAEASPASVAVMQTLCARLAAQGGVALIIDYGYVGPALGDTLQAVRGHGYADPFSAPGSVDLTAHVDFAALASVAEAHGLAIHGPVPQGVWLIALGIGARCHALSQQHPQRADALAGQMRRLVDPTEMGTLFKVMAVTRADQPTPAGFV